MSSSKAFYNSKFYAEWIYLFHLHSVCIVVEIAKLNHPHLTRGPDVALLEVPFVLGGAKFTAHTFASINSTYAADWATLHTEDSKERVLVITKECIVGVGNLVLWRCSTQA